MKVEVLYDLLVTIIRESHVAKLDIPTSEVESLFTILHCRFLAEQIKQCLGIYEVLDEFARKIREIDKFPWIRLDGAEPTVIKAKELPVKFPQ